MPSADDRIFFGQYLQAARLARQLGVDELARQTRIGAATLTAIDQEDLDRLPPPVFLKGFLRAYAAAVGADGEEAVRRYENFLKSRKVMALGAPAPRRGAGGIGRRLVFPLALLGLWIAACLTAYQYATRPPGGDASPEAPPVVGEEAPPVVPKLEALPAEKPSGARAAAAARYFLTISAKEPVWIKAAIDHGTPSEHALKAGEQLKLEADIGFNLLIGNAAGVSLTFDGKPFPVPGRRGEIVNIHLP
jgi:hypothetical protein